MATRAVFTKFAQIPLWVCWGKALCQFGTFGRFLCMNYLAYPYLTCFTHQICQNPPNSPVVWVPNSVKFVQHVFAQVFNISQNTCQAFTCKSGALVAHACVFYKHVKI